MNQLQRVQQLAERVTYKEGWSFEVTPYNGPDICVTTRWLVPLVDDPNHVGMLHNYFTISWHQLEALDDNTILRFAFLNSIRKLEEHEAQEWFKIDGTPVFDPHPNGVAIAADLARHFNVRNKETPNA